MKKINWNRYVPLGVDGKKERNKIGWAYIVACLYSMQIPMRYLGYRNELFEYVHGQYVLIDGAKMVPFRYLIENGGLELFAWLPAALVLLAGYHYIYHRKDTMSIYLMRRLPAPMELHRRCWAMPLLGTIGTPVAATLISAFYYLIYILATPKQCLPLA